MVTDDPVIPKGQLGWARPPRNKQHEINEIMSNNDNEITLPDGLTVDTATDVLREYAQHDDASIIPSNQLDTLRDELQEAKQIFAEVLEEEGSPLSADVLAKSDMEDLTEPFRDEESGEIDIDTLRQTPETGDTKNTQNGNTQTNTGGNGTGGSTGVDLDTLDASTRQEIRDIDLVKIESFENRGMSGRVDTLKAEVAEKVGADSFDDIEAELEAL